jgi:AcrR family transcriptional regulator
MSAIVSGHVRVTQADTRSPAYVMEPPVPTSAEQRLGGALLRCIARWGLAKTTIEDIAREAGMSRATAYRVLPGGKVAILEVAVRSEVARLVDEVAAAASSAEDLEDCLLHVVYRSSCFLTDHSALQFIRDHEPLVLEQYLGFERLEGLFGAAGDLLAPCLDRFLDPRGAHAVAVWLCRLVVSYVLTPSPALDLSDEDDARRFLRTFVLPGLATAGTDPTSGSGPDGAFSSRPAH